MIQSYLFHFYSQLSRLLKSLLLLVLIVSIAGTFSFNFAYQEPQGQQIQQESGIQESQSTTQEAAKETEVFAFGYDIFKGPPEPIIEGPVDETYLISPRDELMITVWGELTFNHLLTVSEEGYIDIPEEGGRVFTNGVTLKELKGLVNGVCGCEDHQSQKTSGLCCWRGSKPGDVHNRIVCGDSLESFD